MIYEIVYENPNQPGDWYSDKVESFQEVIHELTEPKKRWGKTFHHPSHVNEIDRSNNLIRHHIWDATDVWDYSRLTPHERRILEGG